MNDYVITINSTADLPIDWIRENHIPVIPLSFTMEGKTYRDMFDMSSKEFYGRLRAGEMSVTSQVTPESAM